MKPWTPLADMRALPVLGHYTCSHCHFSKLLMEWSANRRILSDDTGMRVAALEFIIAESTAKSTDISVPTCLNLPMSSMSPPVFGPLGVLTQLQSFDFP